MEMKKSESLNSNKEKAFTFYCIAKITDFCYTTRLGFLLYRKKSQILPLCGERTKQLNNYKTTNLILKLKGKIKLC